MRCRLPRYKRKELRDTFRTLYYKPNIHLLFGSENGLIRWSLVPRILDISRIGDKSGLLNSRYQHTIQPYGNNVICRFYETTLCSKIQIIKYGNSDWTNYLPSFESPALLQATLQKLYEKLIVWQCSHCRMTRTNYSQLNQLEK